MFGRQLHQPAVRAHKASASAHQDYQPDALLLLSLPEQFTSVGVCLVINGLLEDAAEVERKPAECKDHHEAEHCLGHLPALRREGGGGEGIWLSIRVQMQQSTISPC